MGFWSRDAPPDTLALPWWFLRLPEPAEHIFIEQTEPERKRQLRFWLIVIFIFANLLFGLDVMSVPDAVRLDLGMRVFVMVPGLILALQLLRRPRSRWVESLAVIISPLTYTLTPLVVFASSSHDDPLLDVIVLCLEVIVTNVLLPMRLRDTIVYSLLAMSLGDSINLWAGIWHHAAQTYTNITVSMHGMILLSVLTRAVGEQNMRHSFARGMKLQLHVEELSRTNTKLIEMSNTDPLTGVANRRYFDSRLEEAWQRAIEKRSPLSLMMIDVDHFKLFNDAAGHLEGDRCLMTVARTIDGQIRRGKDTTARFGGEEFIVLMPDTDAEIAAVIADRVHAAIAAQRVFHPARTALGFVSVSIGVAAMHPSAGTDAPAMLIAAADQAMYAAKAAGRNRVSHAFA